MRSARAPLEVISATSAEASPAPHWPPWSNRVRACIRPNILFDVPVNTPRGRYVAEYQVRLQSDGKQIGSPELKKSSGLSAYDTNVLRAIRLCNPFPQPTGGEAIPSVLTITFDPVDDTAGK